MTDNTGSDKYDNLLAELSQLKARIEALEKTSASESQDVARGLASPSPSMAPVPPSPVPPPLPHKTDKPAWKPIPEDKTPLRASVDKTPLAASQNTDVEKPLTAPRPTAGRTLEQTLGTKWMLLVGAAVLLLSAVFFFKFAYDQGWISPQFRIIQGAIFGLGLICLGEWLRRRGLRLYAGVISAAGIVLLYIVVFVASPNGLYADLQILGPTLMPAFALMCVASAIGIAVSLRSSMETTAVVSLIGAMATPMLLSSGADRQTVLMTYLIFVNAAFLAIALAKEWKSLAPIALSGTALLFALWFVAHYHEHNLHWAWTCAFAWAMMALFTAAGVIAAARQQQRGAFTAAIAVGGQFLVFLWVAQELSTTAFMLQLLTLHVLMATLCFICNWHTVRAALMIWVFLGIATHWLTVAQDVSASGRIIWAIWIWTFFAAATADVLARLWRKCSECISALDTFIATAATGAMFATTYFLLRVNHEHWMGLYAACLGGAVIALSYLIRTRTISRDLAHTYFGQGLILIALAVPIQFSMANITIAWSIQGVVAMLLAKKLHNRLLLVKSPIVLGLAVLHLFTAALPGDEQLAQVAMSIGGVSITHGLVLAASLSAALLAAAAILRSDGKEVAHLSLERTLAACMTAVATWLFFWRTAQELPAIGATWHWLALSTGLAVVGLWRRSDWLSAVGAMALAICAGKWLGFDTLARHVLDGADTERTLVANWQLAAGLAIGAMLVLFATVLARRQIDIRLGHTAPMDKQICSIFGPLAAVMLIWAGSFEINRFFAQSNIDWTNLGQARHMAYSTWWALCAAGIMAAGFVISRPGLRYVSMFLFAITLGKILLVDMREVRAVYRIISFFVLGMALLGGAYLYHRKFLAKPPARSDTPPSA